MLPATYIEADLRNVTPVCPVRQRFGIGFDVAGQPVVRVAIAVQQARFLRAALDEYIASVDAKAPTAQINLMLNESGACRLSATFMGRHDATYGLMDDGKLLTRELPKLLAELRSQIQALSSGSDVTE